MSTSATRHRSRRCGTSTSGCARWSTSARTTRTASSSVGSLACVNSTGQISGNTPASSMVWSCSAWRTPRLLSIVTPPRHDAARSIPIASAGLHKSRMLARKAGPEGPSWAGPRGTTDLADLTGYDTCRRVRSSTERTVAAEPDQPGSSDLSAAWTWRDVMPRPVSSTILAFRGNCSWPPQPRRAWAGVGRRCGGERHACRGAGCGRPAGR